MFKGSMVALVTPMHQDGTIDYPALHGLVEWHIQSKTDALVIAGTTGESATLEYEEQFELISTVVKQVAKRLPVIAGTGTNATHSTIKLSKNAKKAGADACLIVTPYYNKPTQKGLYQHYKTIAENVDIPIILYNVPGRTACDLLPQTIEPLSAIRNIIGIKEATGKVERAQEILERCGADFAIYSGDDATALSLMLHGAKGVISVTANITPLKMHEMCKAVFNNEVSLAEKINTELALLHEYLFLESNPIPTKWALNTMGKIPSGIRLPLLPLDKQYQHKVKEAMQNAGVTK
jgi:4-hydroxy-tetrahydrodipicolinate synthase